MTETMPAARPPLRRLLISALLWLPLAAWLAVVYVEWTQDPDPVWTTPAKLALFAGLFLVGMFPSFFGHPQRDDPDWLEAEDFTLRRRLVLTGLFAVFVAVSLADLSLRWAYEPDPRWLGLSAPAGLVLIGLFVLAMPRGEESPDMRPAWAICALLFAALFYVGYSQ